MCYSVLIHVSWQVHLLEYFDSELTFQEKADREGSMPVDRCTCSCKKTRRRCMREKKHNGNCKFTGDGMMSATTIRKLVACMTSGELKSMAGLDDVRLSTLASKHSNDYKCWRRCASSPDAATSCS